jgi:hypothetical protein
MKTAIFNHLFYPGRFVCIKMDLKKMLFNGEDRFHLNQDKVQWRTRVKTVTNFGAIKGGEFLNQLRDY